MPSRASSLQRWVLCLAVPCCLTVLAPQAHAHPTYITIDAPNAGTNGTFAIGVNKGGVVLATYQTKHGRSRGLLRTPDGSLVVLDIHGAQNTWPTAINNQGTVVGSAQIGPDDNNVQG